MPPRKRIDPEEERIDWLVRLHKIAAENGGKMLSLDYVDDRRAYEFECARGHRFLSRPRRLAAGKWCRRCAGWHKRTIADCVAWAAERGGVCLSEVYVHANYPLRWRCAEGHEWENRPNGIKQGLWCPTCAGKRLKPIAEVRKLAEARGGALLSTEYTDSDAPLRWRCDEGHEFERRVSEVRRGRWCPRCTNMTFPWTLRAGARAGGPARRRVPRRPVRRHAAAGAVALRGRSPVEGVDQPRGEQRDVVPRVLRTPIGRTGRG